MKKRQCFFFETIMFALSNVAFLPRHSRNYTCQETSSEFNDTAFRRRRVRVSRVSRFFFFAIRKDSANIIVRTCSIRTHTRCGSSIITHSETTAAAAAAAVIRTYKSAFGRTGLNGGSPLWPYTRVRLPAAKAAVFITS